jgi:ElaA protein
VTSALSPRGAALVDIDPVTLYRLLRLRVDIFVVEQACPYPELDGRDIEPDAVHWWIEEDGTPLTYLRALVEPDGHRIGRVVTAPAARGRGLAGRLLVHVLDQLPGAVALSAQSHLAGWYARFGFAPAGPEYLEDGIPHIPMTRRS